MVDVIFSWVCAHPLQFVAGLAGLSAWAGLVLIPRVHEINDHGHPRC